MKKGAQSKFDEREHDTATRTYPRDFINQVVDEVKQENEAAKSTALLPKAELETMLQMESGTHPKKLTRDALERHVREHFDDAFSRPTLTAFAPASVEIV